MSKPSKQQKSAQAKPPISNSPNVLAKEEEYRKLNEELEARTRALVSEAETVLKTQQDLLTRTKTTSSRALEAASSAGSSRPILSSLTANDFSAPILDNERDSSNAKNTTSTGHKIPSGDSRSHVLLSSSARGAAGRGRPPPGASAGPSSQPRRNSLTRATPAAPSSSGATGARPESFTDLKRVVSEMVAAAEAAGDAPTERSRADASGADAEIGLDAHVMPPEALQLGAEAQSRFLKAKVRVLQEELDKAAAEVKRLEEECEAQKGHCKEVEEERARLQKQQSTLQQQAEKQKKLIEEGRERFERAEVENANLAKELDALQRTMKSQGSTTSNLELRLNRALAECDQYKSQLGKAKNASREETIAEKRQLDELREENRRLERQKRELIQAFKIQQRLIDVLKRQKMHLEASKLLAFTEEEFLKVLEWEH